ncbi:uncharacterized protein [Antedon mediterranea]|uniref:uncharacterized protein n=1 Tax=Antedon mediterranea TaxID=105859 RepID=UPI003AF7F735
MTTEFNPEIVSNFYIPEIAGFCSDFEDDFDGWVNRIQLEPWKRSMEENNIDPYTGKPVETDNYYISVKSSNGLEHIAAIQSPELPPSWRCVYVQFYYYMSGSSPKQRLVVKHYIGPTSYKILNNIYATGNNKWTLATAILYANYTPDYVIFRGYTTGHLGNIGRIAIDNVYISEVDCIEDTKVFNEYFIYPDQSKNITSPNYPNDYPKSVSYNWTLHTYPGYLLLLTFTDFQLEQDSDYVSIQDEDRIVKYTGFVLPPVILSSNNSLVVMFRTDGSSQYRGFSANVVVYNDRRSATIPTTTVRKTNPETTSPETTSIETTSPETTGPETTGPETTGPETTSPETTGPETTGPETTSPETTSPETTSSETTRPECTSPESTSQETTSATNIPDMHSLTNDLTTTGIGISTTNSTNIMTICSTDSEKPGVSIHFESSSPEVKDVPLTSEPDSITFSTSTKSYLVKDGPFQVVATQNDVNSTAYFYVESQDSPTLQSVSDIVTIDIYDNKGNELSIDCEIRFPIKDVVKDSLSMKYEHLCHFTEEENPFAIWSTEGCSTVNDADGVICNCTHMTSFVVLMKPIPSSNDKILSTLTNFGLIISSIFLIITLITVYSFKQNYYFRNLRNSERHKILCHLVVALLIVNFVYFLLGANVKNKIVCAVIAGCLHYSLLAAFTWMLIVSTDVYMKIRHPFVNHERRFLFSRYLGWIVPSIIVGVTAGCTKDNYVSDDVCWLNMDIAIWTFIIPMLTTLLIIFLQTVVIGYIAFKKTRLPQQSKDDKTSYTRIRSLVYGLGLLTPVVGLPWIFGIIILFSSSKVMEYIFVIMNSLQGFFIWLSQCVFSNEVQYDWRKTSSNRTHPDTTDSVITMTDTTRNKIIIEDL